MVFRSVAYDLTYFMKVLTWSKVGLTLSKLGLSVSKCDQSLYKFGLYHKALSNVIFSGVLPLILR